MIQPRVNVHAAKGGGGVRQPFRIKEHLAAIGVNQLAVARMAQVSHSLVSETIHGARNNRKVLRALVALKCPKRFLGLPKDMVEDEGEA